MTSDIKALTLAAMLFVSHLGMAYAQTVDDNVITLATMGAAADLCGLRFPTMTVDTLIAGALAANGGNGDAAMVAVQMVENMLETKIIADGNVEQFCNEMLPLAGERPS